MTLNDQERRFSELSKINHLNHSTMCILDTPHILCTYRYLDIYVYNFKRVHLHIYFRDINTFSVIVTSDQRSTYR